MSHSGQQVARFLRQRAELGFSDLVLESLTRGAVFEALELVDQEIPAQPPAGFTSEDSAALVSGVAKPAMESPEALGDLPVLPDDLAVLRNLCSGCHHCGLAESRRHVVFADGSPAARLMVVGEAPGAQEDETGLPFVGRAGMLLDLLLQTAGLSRKESVYICNVIKCRPPGNRNPSREEISSCSPYLKKQIALIKPEVILAVGTFSGQLLSGKEEPLGQLRSGTHAYEGVPVVVTYHPAALLRNPGWVRPTWDDVQKVAHMLRGKERGLP